MGHTRQQTRERSARREDLGQRTEERQRLVMAAQQRDLGADVKEIGPPPAIVDEDRRHACEHDLRLYLLTYHPAAFTLDFGADHIRLIEMTQDVLLNGGQVVAAMPRGSGKTTIFQYAQLWATLYAHRRYPMLITADDIKYRRLLRGIKTVLETNDLLLQDFPEVIYPIRCLERVPIRGIYQTCRGESTGIQCSTSTIIFPTIEESKQRGNAGAVLAGGGLTGAALRGALVTLPSGEQLRPDAVLIDDPQTRKSAKSTSQVQEREDTIQADILGMSGPGKQIAAMVACTVIYRGDLADRLMDRDRSPNWKSIRVPMIKAWPKNMKLWEEYDALRRSETFGEVDAGTAQQSYVAHRAEMDEGAQVYWDARLLPGRVSALQSAMDDYYDSPHAFMSEKQNCPDEESGGDLAALNPLELVRRVSTWKRGEVPANCTTLTCHIDCQARILYWMVVAWSQGFQGHVVDYGTAPKQSRRHFNLRDVKQGIQEAHPDLDEFGAFRKTITDTITMLATRRFERSDGVQMPIERGLIDARWRPNDVELAIRAAAGISNWLPCYGVGISAKSMPLARWAVRPGARRGMNWLLHRPDKRQMLSFFYDTNFWKTQAHQSLSIPSSHTQAVTLFREASTFHQLVADHWCSERAVRVEAKGRVVDEWDLPSSKPDNHYWDNLVACFAAASLCGIKSNGERLEPKPKPPARTNRVSGLKI